MNNVHPQRAALVLQQVGDINKLGISSALDIACGAGVEGDERTAAGGDIRSAARTRIIDAVGQILAAAFPLLVQVEGVTLDGQSALLHVDHAGATVEGAVFYGQVALHHVDDVAVVLLGIYGAVASVGHLGAIRDGQDRVDIIAPDVFRVLDGLAVQIQCDVLVDGQLGVLLNIRQQSFSFGRAKSTFGDPNCELFPPGPIIPVPSSAPLCRPVGVCGNN